MLQMISGKILKNSQSKLILKMTGVEPLKEFFRSKRFEVV